MGLSLRKKEVPDPTTGLTASDTKLVRETWRSLCSLDSDYGVLVFQALFIRHPEFLPMFSRFKDKDVDSLPDDVHFRAHACAVGNQLTSMVGSADDVRLLDALIQKNAMAHTKRRGVAPPHFHELGSCVIEVLALKFEKMMTPQAVAAWEKLFAQQQQQLQQQMQQQFQQFQQQIQEQISPERLQALVDTAVQRYCNASESPLPSP
ncbi:cytoglobin-2-like [Haemaphysalis longicornis]